MFKLIPAISEQILNVLFANKEKLNNKNLTWWGNSHFQMDGGLLSAYYLYMRTDEYYKNFRESINFPKNNLFIIDSGGYELETQQNSPELSHQNVQKNLTPLKVLDIQEANADIGFILDRPPYRKVINQDLSVSWIHDPTFFINSMEFTAKNTETALNNRKNPNLKLYGILQGETYEDMIIWYNRMKGYKVDGWAVVPTPKSNYSKTMMYISLILENNFNIPIHFLGISGFNSLALIIYLSRYYPYLLTSDSSSYNSGAKNRSYTLPGDFRSNIVIGRINDIHDVDNMGNKILIQKKNSSTIPLETLPCECPICINTSVEEMRSATNIGSIAVSLHNLYQQKLMIKILTSLISHPDTYKQYVYKFNDMTSKKEMETYFNLIDNIISHKRGYTKIKYSWISQSGENNIKLGDLLV